VTISSVLPAMSSKLLACGSLTGLIELVPIAKSEAVGLVGTP